jgi:hypothetical protein
MKGNTMEEKGTSLEAILKDAQCLFEVRKPDVQPGDTLIITTLNSTYHVHVLGNGQYSVCGGWFDNNGLSPFLTSITGCTWGGSVIKVDSLAACGLSIEFGNRVVTSAVKKIIVFKWFLSN